MEIQVNGHTCFCYTGGKAFEASKPTAVLIHGVLNDHSVWILQSRYLAHHGWNVLALDLPGHGRSGGEPPASVEEAARFIVALLDAAGVARAALIGHSFGSLIALQTAADAPQRVSQLVMVGTAYPMKVSSALLEASLNAPEQAMAMVNTWLYGSLRALMRRVLASNPRVNLFHTGFKACDDYRGGDAAMDAVACPTLFILGREDQMTTPKAAAGLIARARQGQVRTVPAGHALMSEAPDGVLFALKEFLRPPAA